MHMSKQTQSESHVGSEGTERKQQRASVQGWQIEREGKMPGISQAVADGSAILSVT